MFATSEDDVFSKADFVQKALRRPQTDESCLLEWYSEVQIGDEKARRVQKCFLSKPGGRLILDATGNIVVRCGNCTGSAYRIDYEGVGVKGIALEMVTWVGTVSSHYLLHKLRRASERSLFLT